MPPRTKKDEGFFALSSGSRKFLRYGYGDLLAENRRYRVLHRIWPGTQRLLLWGDPVTAAAYSRAFSFCGTEGVEKPDTEIFRRALERVASTAERTVYVGDNPRIDVRPALSIGMGAVLVDRRGVHVGFRDAAVVRSLEQVPSVIR